MITLLTLSIVCLVAVVLIFVVLAIIGLPLLLLLGLLPWLLRIAGVVLLVKALFDKPVKWENFMPATSPSSCPPYWAGSCKQTPQSAAALGNGPLLVGPRQGRPPGKRLPSALFVFEYFRQNNRGSSNETPSQTN